MNIPSSISLGFIDFQSLYLFSALGVFTGSFVVWRLGRRDGFKEFRLFDLFVVSSFLNYILYVFTPLSVYSFIFGALIPIYFFCRLWHWSVFRVFDVFSLSWSFGIFIHFIGKFLIYKEVIDLVISFIFFVAFVTFGKLRDRSLKSGVIFSFFICIGVLLGLSLNISVPYLIFYLLLVTLSTVNLYLRFTKDMPNNKLPEGLFKFLKEQLLSKEKRLKAEQKNLIDEDPYLKGDRAVGNSDEMDEAILEDARKLEMENQKESINKMQILVRKALAMMKIGKYGTCEVCGSPIESARLKAFPEATTCIQHSK